MLKVQHLLDNWDVKSIFTFNVKLSFDYLDFIKVFVFMEWKCVFSHAANFNIVVARINKFPIVVDLADYLKDAIHRRRCMVR